MSCPTCDHTLQTVLAASVRHCPRCGTLVIEGGGRRDVCRPRLVDHHRQFIDLIEPEAFRAWLALHPEEEGKELSIVFCRFFLEQLTRSGVVESILPPAARPAPPPIPRNGKGHK